VAHYIAGVLEREAMIEIVEGLCESAEFNPAIASKRCGFDPGRHRECLARRSCGVAARRKPVRVNSPSGEFAAGLMREQGHGNSAPIASAAE